MDRFLCGLANFDSISLLVTIAAAGASEDPAIRAQIPLELRKSKTLILCPASLLENWRDELATWTPESSHLGKIFSIQSGTAGQSYTFYVQIKEWDGDGGILITSYDLFRQMLKKSEKDGKPFVEEEHENVKKWLLLSPTLVVADEAHTLRSRNSQTTQAVAQIRTAKRIAMTGSPLANSLMDYYWMMSWVAPEFLETPERFKTRFLHRIENGCDIESTKQEQREALQALALLSQVLSPKIHRVDMSELKHELPPKHEFTIVVALSQIQKDCYNLFVEAVREGAAAGMTSQILSWMGTLQLCCNHPWAFQKRLAEVKDKKKNEHVGPISNLEHTPTEEEVSRTILFKINKLLHKIPNIMDAALSNRVLILDKIIEESLKCGDKILIFSQSIPTLDYLESFMKRSSRSYSRIDGTTPARFRQDATRKFNSGGKESVFLISTRAGGLGLNIQGANRVVIFDFTFNPTWEKQAIGRAYRIGQKKTVYVYYLLSGGTFERLVHQKTLFKSELALRVVDNRNVARAGSKSVSPYLFNCVDVKRDEHPNQEACVKDPAVMLKILHSEVAKGISGVTVLDDHLQENECLTSAEGMPVEDEL
jgi:SNF2 family DNA or RNA helicase